MVRARSNSRLRIVGRFSLIAGALAMLTACGFGSSAPQASSEGLSGTISVEYNPGFVFDALSYGNTWWATVQQQFQAQYPKAHLNLIPLSGNLIATVNKLSLDFRNPSTAPDVAQINTQYAGQFAASNYLLPLDNYLTPSEAPFWSHFPANVKAEDTYKGHVIAIDQGANVSALFYNKTMFEKAGLPSVWAPKSWNDILAAARQVKSANPGVTPLWLSAGTSVGAGGITQGTGNLIYGSSTPMIYDSATQKWVVDSPGLRQVFQFYKTVYSEGLGAPVSALFSPTAIGQAPTLMSKGQIAIAIGSNWYPGAWALAGSGATWPAATTEVGAAPIPNAAGTGQASTLQAWTAIVSKHTKYPNLAWGLIKIMESDANLIYIANYAGFVPPNGSLATSSDFVQFAPLQGTVAKYLPTAKALPSYETGYAVWVRGIEEATAQLAQSPTSTSVSDAINTVKSTVSNQLDPSAIETLH